MKLERNEDTNVYNLSSIKRDELELLKCSLYTVHKLLSSISLDNLTDNQEKDVRIKRLETLLKEITSLNDSQAAESWDATIIRKVLEKTFNAN